MFNTKSFTPIRSMVELRQKLGVSNDTLHYVLNSLSRYYYKSKNYKRDENGNVRIDKYQNEVYWTLTPSTGELKRIQQRIQRYLSTFPLPLNVHGGVAPKDHVSNASGHCNNYYFFTTDIRNFFGSISSIQVYSALLEIGHPHHIARQITKLTTYNNQLPIGAPTSTVLSNLIMINVDKELNNLCKEYGLYYSRFVDNITISGQKQISQYVIDLAISAIARSKLKISRKKTHLARGYAYVTGVLIRRGAIYAPKGLYIRQSNPNVGAISKLGIMSSIQRIKRENRRLYIKGAI